MMDSDEEADLLERAIEVKAKNIMKGVKKEKAKEKEQLTEFCSLCNRTMMDQSSLFDHVNSRRHKDKLRRATREEVKSSPSVRDYLLNKGMLFEERTKYQKLLELLYNGSLKKMCFDWEVSML